MKVQCPNALLPSLNEVKELTSRAAVAEHINIAPKFDFSEFEGLKAKEAITDYKHVLLFLSIFTESKETFGSYRRDIERLLMWMWAIQKVTFDDLDSQQIRVFLEFIKSPPANWIMDKQYRREVSGKPNPKWRPFRSDGDGSEKYQFSGSAYKAMLATLSSFFGHLSQIEYIRHNPIANLRQKRKYGVTKGTQSREVRRLSEDQISACYQAVDEMADADPEAHERTRFLFIMMLNLYLRISEVVASEEHVPTMSDFKRNHEGHWFFNVPFGKGRKTRMVTVPDCVLQALVRYREHLGLNGLPSPGEKTPLLPKERGFGGISSTRQVRRILEDVFGRASVILREQNNLAEANSIYSTTAHWLRHTGISEDAEKRPLTHVRDDAGHDDIKTTSLYIDADTRARAESRKNT